MGRGGTVTVGSLEHLDEAVGGANTLDCRDDAVDSPEAVAAEKLLHISYYILARSRGRRKTITY